MVRHRGSVQRTTIPFGAGFPPDVVTWSSHQESALLLSWTLSITQSTTVIDLGIKRVEETVLAAILAWWFAPRRYLTHVRHYCQRVRSVRL